MCGSNQKRQLGKICFFPVKFWHFWDGLTFSHLLTHRPCSQVALSNHQKFSTHRGHTPIWYHLPEGLQTLSIQECSVDCLQVNDVRPNPRADEPNLVWYRHLPELQHGMLLGDRRVGGRHVSNVDVTPKQIVVVPGMWKGGKVGGDQEKLCLAQRQESRP